MKNSQMVKLFCVLLVMGLGVSAIGYALGGKSGAYINNTGIHLPSGDTKTLRVDEQLEFSELSINVSILDVNIISGDRFYIDAKYYEGNDVEYSLDGGKLSITTPYAEDGFNIGIMGMNIGFFMLPNTESNVLTVCIPKSRELSNVEVKSSTGSTKVSALRCRELSVRGSIGDVSLDGIETGKLGIQTSTGGLTLKNIKAESLTTGTDIGDTRISDANANQWDISSNTGSIDLRKAECETAKIRTDIGDIRLKEWKSSGLELKSTTGGINIEGSLLGNNAIRSDIGDVRMTLNEEKALYRTDFTAGIGDIRVNPEGIVDAPESGAIPYTLEIHTGTGSINVTFSK